MSELKSNHPKLLNTYKYLLLALISLSFCHCNKQDKWLDVKSQKSQITPKTLKDLQAILDNFVLMNQSYPALGMVSDDNRYVLDQDLLSFIVVESNAYLWEKNLDNGTQNVDDWNQPYKIVECANIIMEVLTNIDLDGTNELEYKRIKASALFFRANAFYFLAQLFCNPYSENTANVDLGIPIRLSADINVRSKRSTVQETYNQILNDLTSALALLDDKPSSFVSRPSQLAVKSLLAKVYLTMENYSNAEAMADAVLEKKNQLIDFNSLSTSANRPFPNFTSIATHPEIIFYATGINHSSVFPLSTSAFVDNDLYNLYDSADLRKYIFYSSSGAGNVFKGSYGFQYPFSGIAVNELYLIRSEARIRNGRVAQGINDLNSLLERRYLKGHFEPFTPTSPDEALLKVLTERRKELPNTGQLRWEDLRRLNKDAKFAKVLSRPNSMASYVLQPNDKRYTLPIPTKEILMSGLEQNIR